MVTSETGFVGDDKHVGYQDALYLAVVEIPLMSFGETANSIPEWRLEIGANEVCSIANVNQSS